MVKVLENALVDLDLMPGSSQQELKQLAQAQLSQSGTQTADKIKEQASSIYSKLPEEQQKWLEQGVDKLNPTQKQQLQESILGEMPEPQQEQARSYLASAASIGKGAVSTVGTAAKGVGDTLGNTVGALAGGLGKTAGGVYSSAKDTTGFGEKQQSGPSLDDVAQAGKSGADDTKPARSEKLDA